MKHDGTADADTYYCVHEVYYAADGTVTNWTHEPTRKPFGESLDDLLGDLSHVILALNMPVLSYADGKEVEGPPGATNLRELALKVGVGR